MGRKSLLKSKVAVPPSSLRLLVPPIRLMAAEMWQVVQRCQVVHYGKLEEFVLLVAEVFPDILCQKEMFLLILGLRGRMILKLCQEDHKSAAKAIQSHIARIRQCEEDLQQRENSDLSLETVVGNFLKLVQNLLKDSSTSNNFFQEVFPSLYGKKFDSALQSLMGEFLSRLEKMLPVPDFKEAASFLSDSPSDLELCFQTVTDPEKLKTVLLHKPTTTKFDRETPFGDTIMLILSYQSSVAVDQQPVSSEEASSTVPTNGEETTTCLEQNGNVDEFVEECEEDDVALLEEEEKSEKTSEEIVDSEKAETRNENKRTSAKPPQGHKKHNKPQRECPSCGKTCKSPAGLKRHLRLHSHAFTLSCTSCKRRFRTDAALKKHMEVHARPPLPDERHKKSKVKEPFPCSLCGKSHAKPNPPACDQCGRRYCTYVGLYRHRKLHSGERPYLCTVCGKGFTYSDILKAHMRTHTGERSHICTICGKKFVQGCGLVRHLRIHADERPFACTSCSKSFRSKPELELHVRTHTGERPYQCSQCGKRFVASNHLRNHMRTHTGARPHSCPHCDKCFGSPDQLRKHILVHTGEKPHECPECGKRFSQQGNMKIHLRTHGGPKVFE